MYIKNMQPKCLMLFVIKMYLKNEWFEVETGTSHEFIN
jgi:hypothetical protein